VADESIVALLDVSAPSPGSQYVLAREVEWSSDRDLVTVWRGPNKPDEHLPRMRLRTIDCESMRVTKAGFWDCEEIFEDLEQEVERVADEILDDQAAMDQAMVWSYPDSYVEDFGNEVFITATFGDWTAVNGDIRADIDPPRGYKKTDRGGSIPTADAEIERDSLYDPVHREVEKVIGRPIPEKLVKGIINELYPERYIYWGTSGESTVWVSKEAYKLWEMKEEFQREGRSARSQEERAALEEHLRAERARVEAERRQQIRDDIASGKYGTKQDWSPRGEIPGIEI